MTHGSLFSGIGGFELAAEWCGFENVFSCEQNPFGQRVLKHYWPNADHHDNVKTFPASDYTGRIDILTGGFPCQPYSVAGKRLGKDDDRHLWPFMLDIIREVAPTYVVGENVRGLVNWSGGMVFEEVCADLEAEGYDVQPFVLPAAGVGAPHRRDRVWFVAHANGGADLRTPRGDASASQSQRLQKRDEVWQPEVSDSVRATSNTNNRRARHEVQARRDKLAGRAWSKFPTQSAICGGDDGLPAELDGITFPKWRAESIKAYGNAIVPQVALQIFETIKQTEQ